jgi:hypothetical protein
MIQFSKIFLIISLSRSIRRKYICIVRFALKNWPYTLKKYQIFSFISSHAQRFVSEMFFPENERCMKSVLKEKTLAFYQVFYLEIFKLL